MNLYGASTSGNSGKPLLALGLAKIWAGRGVSVGYVKPLGKIPVVEDGAVVDEDAAFLSKELGLPGQAGATSSGPRTAKVVELQTRHRRPGSFRDIRHRGHCRSAVVPSSIGSAETWLGRP